MKWNKVRNAKYRFAAEKISNVTITNALTGHIRVDVLTWDTEDRRHKIKNRDDRENLQRMYFHLYKNVLKRRWSADARWCLFPDHNSLIDWSLMKHYLDRYSTTPTFKVREEENVAVIEFLQDFQIHSISEISAKDIPLCQVADLFAGAAAFSWSNSNDYFTWLYKENGQIQLFEDINTFKYTNSQEERYKFLRDFVNRCRKHGLGIDISYSSGLRTPNPINPINFWLYQPQRVEDKAPIRLLP